MSSRYSQGQAASLGCFVKQRNKISWRPMSRDYWQHGQICCARNLPVGRKKLATPAASVDPRYVKHLVIGPPLPFLTPLLSDSVADSVPAVSSASIGLSIAPGTSPTYPLTSGTRASWRRKRFTPGRGTGRRMLPNWVHHEETLGRYPPTARLAWVPCQSPCSTSPSPSSSRTTSLAPR